MKKFIWIVVCIIGICLPVAAFRHATDQPIVSIGDRGQCIKVEWPNGDKGSCADIDLQDGNYDPRPVFGNDAENKAEAARIAAQLKKNAGR